jgi:DivIVA domain-containing protein
MNDDDSFRLTPIEVRRQDFARVMRGYDPAAVEDFKMRVAEEMDRLTRANQDLEAKARGFHEQLRAFRERDKALNEALVSAQQLRSEIREQAERESQLILREARAEGERLIDAARAEIERLQREVEQLERARRTYLSHLRTIVERQLAEIEAASAEPVARDDGNSNEQQRHSRQTPAWLNSLIKE